MEVLQQRIVDPQPAGPVQHRADLDLVGRRRDVELELVAAPVVEPRTGASFMWFHASGAPSCIACSSKHRPPPPSRCRARPRCAATRRSARACRDARAPAPAGRSIRTARDPTLSMRRLRSPLVRGRRVELERVRKVTRVLDREPAFGVAQHAGPGGFEAGIDERDRPGGAIRGRRTEGRLRHAERAARQREHACARARDH
jgi:hypothetical protein